MNDWWRIRLGMLALILGVSCGGGTLNTDAGAPLSGAAGVTGVSGRAGAGGAASGGGPGGQSGTFGSGTGGIATGAGGFAGTFITGRGGFGGMAGTVTTGRGGFMGAAGISGRGGTGGTAGITGTGGIGGLGGIGGMFVTGRGGIAGTSDFAGRGGIGGIAGLGGIGGRGGTGGVAGMGGTGGIGGVAGMGGAAGTGGTAGRGGGAGAGCSTCRTAILEIDASDLVYSAARNELYASVQGDAAAYPNTILVVDPNTASVVSAIPIGSNPGPLALSDDGSTLWVGIQGAHAIRKVTMSSTPPVVGPLIHLPKANPNQYFDALSMAVLAGAPLSVAVVLSDGSFTSEVRVFDDGVPRATAVTNLPGSAYGSASVIAGPPGTVFGIDGGTYSFYVYAVSPSGITVTPSFSVLRFNAIDSLASVGGRVFTGSGDAINVANLAAPVWAGRLPYTGPVARRDAMSVMMLTLASLPFPANERTDVRIYSNDLLTELATVTVPEDLGATYSHLVYAGGDAAAVIRRGGTVVGPPQALVIVHDPAFGAPIGGTVGTGGVGGTGGAGGAGGAGGVGGTGGAPGPCPGCTITTVQAYGRDMVLDPVRNLIYVAADAMAAVHPSSIVTVDPTTAAVASITPVGNDPQSLALSDDGSALWVGLVGERRVRRLTPGATLVPGPAYSLPMLLSTGEASVPAYLAVLPGAPSSIAVGVYGSKYYNGRGVFILDDGQPRANFIQPPEVPANFLTNGPPGYLLGVGDTNNLVAFHLGVVGATMESYGGLFTNYYNASGFLYSAGAVYASTGEVIDLTDPDAPVPAGRFLTGGANCKLASRSATRVMMLCPEYAPGGILFMLDNTTFNQVGSVTLPNQPYGSVWVKFLYLGGDAVAMLGDQTPLQIMRAPMIGSPP